METKWGIAGLVLVAACASTRVEERAAESISREEIRAIVREEVEAALATSEPRTDVARVNARAHEARTVDAAWQELQDARRRLLAAQRTYTEESETVAELRARCERAQKRYDELRETDAK